ncbi:hypothetical protein BV20DRAFT_997309 [Pilatotrama ljubarskyi]|nr:hypothetical protein BV20DRAFT_997309 [Pilatotrama ljubarskyi]
MSEDMPASWRSIASAASRSLKGYIAQQRELKQAYPLSRGAPPQSSEAASKKQSWSQWAGQKLRRGSQNEYDVSGDRLSLFPGWATRRYREPRKDGQEDIPFDVDVFVSGYACKLTGVGFNTRAGRAFLRLAKSFASLPKLPNVASATTTNTPLSRSTEDLLAHTHLPPLPDEITEESEMEALSDRLHRLEFDTRSVDSGRSGPAALSVASSSDTHGSRTPSAASGASSSHPRDSNPSPPPSGTPLDSGSASGWSDLQRWHANLEARLHPFWSSALVNRTVRVSLYATNPSLYDGGTDESVSSESSESPEKQPIMTREVITGVDGSFQVKFSVPWEHMCVHPSAVHIAFGGPDLEQDLFVVAELLAPPSPGPGTPTTPQGPSRYTSSFPAQATTSTSIAIPLTHSSIRVISDIDDTVKASGILGGARAVFHNVFVKDLRDSVIRGMGDWYTKMWKRGVRFHYVSNGPYELLPVVNEFLQISRLPPGSIRLRSYGGRSLFNGLLSAPAMRKRAGVLDVLNHFPEARFFLVGDSGEQDLELYAEIARERPDQILGVFIRDAGVRGESVRALDDPTGADAFREGVGAGLGTPGSAPAGGGMRGVGRRFTARYGPSRAMSMSDADATPPPSPSKPSRTYSGSDVIGAPAPMLADDYFGSGARAHSPITEEPGASPEMGTPSSFPPAGFARPRASPGSGEWRDMTGRWQAQTAGMSEGEKKRWELQMRVWRARMDMPAHIPIRVFREPEECVEVDEILDRLQVRGLGTRSR